MRDRTDFEKQFIDGPALELAMMPVEVRVAKIMKMGVDAETWIAEEFPELSPDKGCRGCAILDLRHHQACR